MLNRGSLLNTNHGKERGREIERMQQHCSRCSGKRVCASERDKEIEIWSKREKDREKGREREGESAQEKESKRQRYSV